MDNSTPRPWIKDKIYLQGYGKQCDVLTDQTGKKILHVVNHPDAEELANRELIFTAVNKYEKLIEFTKAWIWERENNNFVHVDLLKEAKEFITNTYPLSAGHR